MCGFLKWIIIVNWVGEMRSISFLGGLKMFNVFLFFGFCFNVGIKWGWVGFFFFLDFGLEIDFM